MYSGLSAALLAATALAAPIKIGCIGDSITAGVCGGNGGCVLGHLRRPLPCRGSAAPAHSPPLPHRPNSYPTILQGLLGAGYAVTNLGNSGKTMLKYGEPGDSSYWNQSTWPAAQALNADVYTILLGTNDAKNGGASLNWFPCVSANGWQDCSWVGGDNYTADYLDMIGILKRQPAQPRVFIMQPTPLYKQNVFGCMNQTVTNFVLPRLLPTIMSASAAEPQIIDLFDALGGAGLTQPNITSDSCHPRHAGYVEMAQVIYKVLSKTIAEAGWPAYTPATEEQMCVAGRAGLRGRAGVQFAAHTVAPPRVPPPLLPLRPHAVARPFPGPSGTPSTRLTTTE